MLQVGQKTSQTIAKKEIIREASDTSENQSSIRENAAKALTYGSEFSGFVLYRPPRESFGAIRLCIYAGMTNARAICRTITLFPPVCRWACTKSVHGNALSD